MEYFLVFGSAHRALKAEAVLKGSSIQFKLLPAPKPLVKYCGLVIRVAGIELTAASSALKKGGVKVKSIYKREGDGYVEV